MNCSLNVRIRRDDFNKFDQSELKIKHFHSCPFFNESMHWISNIKTFSISSDEYQSI